jgi:hypothetical protein
VSGRFISKDGKITRFEPDDDTKEEQLRGCLRAALRQQVYADVSYL